MILRDDESEYDYIFTCVDNFEDIAKDQSISIDLIDSDLIFKENGPLNYYIDNDYVYGCQTYAKEFIARVAKYMVVFHRNQPLC